jgi:murein DD-endopeptidase MepM/ murein hydrolase activator NlpD
LLSSFLTKINKSFSCLVNQFEAMPQKEILVKIIPLLFVIASMFGAIGAGQAEKSASAFVPPVAGPIVARFGEARGYRGNMATHNGVDFGCTLNNPVVAFADGTVLAAGQSANRHAGITVRITHTGGVLAETRYFHLASVSVCAGQALKAGDAIGNCGATGVETGTDREHLHFEVVDKDHHIADPCMFMTCKK